MICYICGKDGANTKDHVIPKTFLGPTSKTYPNRLTLRAHKDCNRAYSTDEDYARDVIAPGAIVYQLPDIAAAVDRTNRSILRPQGGNRRETLLSTNRPATIRSSGGVITGRGISIYPNWSRILNVARKIACGIAFKDTMQWVDPASIVATQIPTGCVVAERKQELQRNNPYWIAISSAECLHTNFSDSIAVRRVYVATQSHEPQLICSMLIMLMSECFIINFPVPVGNNFNRKLKLVKFKETRFKK
jgi:hypothetical protein